MSKLLKSGIACLVALFIFGAVGFGAGAAAMDLLNIDQGMTKVYAAEEQPPKPPADDEEGACKC